MYELSIARPHERAPRGYTVAEWPIYCAGYYCALQTALRVMQATARRFNLRRKARRLENVAANTKTGAA